MSSKPSCFQPAAYDPHAPLRSPMSRWSAPECTADMTACMHEICAAHGQGTVTEADLVRAGFTPDEIERYRGAAVAALSERVGPRDVRAEPSTMTRAA